MRKKRRAYCPGFSLNLEGQKVSDKEIVQILREFRADPFFQQEGGSKALSRYLKRDFNLIVNHKKVYRLLRQEKLLLSKRAKKVSKFKKKVSQNRIVKKENEVWEFDIKYGYLPGENRFFFILAFIDVFTRKIKGYYTGRHCHGEDIQRTLKLAIKDLPESDLKKLVIRSDNGSQMRSQAMKDCLSHLPIEHEFIPVKTPNKNAHIESFFSILDRYLEEQYFLTLREAYIWLSDFIGFYNKYRIHGSLKMTPSEFAGRRDLHDNNKLHQSI